MIRLQSSRYTGYLYQFCGTWEDLEKIVTEGIRLKSAELDWIKDPRLAKEKFTEEKRYASLTRNPSAIIQQSNRGWRYAAIIDGDKLTSNEITHPMNFNTSPGWKSFTITDMHDGTFEIDSDYGGTTYVSSDEGGQLIDWLIDPDLEESINLTQPDKDTLEVELILGKGDNRPADALFTLEEYEDEVRHENPNLDDTQVEKAAEKRRQEEFDNGKRTPIDIHDLPGVAWRVLHLSMDEEEERLYTRDKGSVVYLGKDAIVGVLVPDVEYFSSIADTFRRLYHLPMYIYRDYKFNFQSSETYQKFKKMMQLNPEIKSLYRFPG